MSNQIGANSQQIEADRLDQLTDILFGSKSRELDTRMQALEAAVAALQQKNEILTQELAVKSEHIQLLERVTIEHTQSNEGATHNILAITQALVDLLYRESVRDDATANALHGMQAAQDEFTNQMLSHMNTMRKQSNKQFAALQQMGRDSQTDRNATSEHLRSVMDKMKKKN